MTPPKHYTKRAKEKIAQFLDLVPTFIPVNHDTDADEQKLLGLIWWRIYERDTIQNLYSPSNDGIPHESIVIRGDDISHLFKGQEYSHVIQSLTGKGLIHRKSRDVDNGECFRYCIRTAAWKDHALGIVRRTERAAFPKWVNQTRDTKHGSNDPDDLVDLITLKSFEHQLSRIRLSKNLIKQFDDWQTSLRPSQFFKYQSAIRAIVSAEHWITHSSQGRLYSSFTNLPKAIRRNLEVNVNGKWEKLVELDIKACFPTLLAQFYLNPNLISVETFDREALDKEFEKFKRIIIEKDFYKHLFDSISKNRDNLKLGFSCYCNGYYDPDWDYYRLLKRELPLLADIIHPTVSSYNKTERTHLGRKLHKIESTIMIDETLKELGGGNFFDDDLPILTVHDAVLTTKEHAPRITKHIQDLFEDQLKIRPVITVKS